MPQPTENIACFPAGALRFLRRILGLKDEFYNRYIVKGKLFDAVISAFKENGHKYNLLDSAVVELFEFVRVVGITSDSRPDPRKCLG